MRMPEQQDLSAAPGPSDLFDPALAILADRIAHGDRDAFAAFYDALCHEAGAIAARSLAARDAVAVVSMTFLHIWWLAPLHSRDDLNVRQWLTEIVAQRTTDRVHTGLSAIYDDAAESVLQDLLGRRRPRYRSSH